MNLDEELKEDLENAATMLWLSFVGKVYQTRQHAMDEFRQKRQPYLVTLSKTFGINHFNVGVKICEKEGYHCIVGVQIKLVESHSNWKEEGF